MIRTSGLPVAILVIVAIAACSPQAATSPSADAPSDASSVAASESEQASATAEPTEAPPASIAADADLATVLPGTVAGQEMTKRSGSGEESAGTLPFAIAGGVADFLGIPHADMAWASAAAPNADAAGNHVMWAVRFPGADSAQLIEQVTTALGGVALAAGQIDVTEETIDGKAVSVLPISAEGSSTYYVYAVGDVLFVFQTPDRAEADDAIGQLP
jgi:hypothetical protein